MSLAGCAGSSSWLQQTFFACVAAHDCQAMNQKLLSSIFFQSALTSTSSSVPLASRLCRTKRKHTLASLCVYSMAADRMDGMLGFSVLDTIKISASGGNRRNWLYVLGASFNTQKSFASHTAQLPPIDSKYICSTRCLAKDL